MTIVEAMKTACLERPGLTAIVWPDIRRDIKHSIECDM